MIVLLGGSGYVGQAIQQALQTAGHSFEVWSRKTVRYTDRDQLITALRHLKPDFLINAAGFTGRPNVDACEYQKTDCLAGNAVLPGIVRDACEAAQVPWGHVSSGCIFTGTRSDGSGFAETDPPNFSFRQNNCSFYSGCKALGEEVLHGASQCYIWR
ncbi:MAG: sugar nucleotide-binding protein, partial [Planctomycetaceae bacterium]|nr:sugar nucleotide-binding protein [Planctomycetaceae bacterium]